MMLRLEDERRQSRRFQVKEDAFAFIDNTPFTIQNISAGGLMLQSVVFDEAPSDNMTLDIFHKTKEIYLKDIPVRLISQIKSKAVTPFSAIQVKRFGVAFDKLDEKQRGMLDSLISSITVGEA